MQLALAAGLGGLARWAQRYLFHKRPEAEYAALHGPPCRLPHPILSQITPYTLCCALLVLRPMLRHSRAYSKSN